MGQLTKVILGGEKKLTLYSPSAPTYIGSGDTADVIPLNPAIPELGTTVQTALTELAPKEFTQSVAASTWTFNHTLNRRPGVHVTDLVGNTLFVETQVTRSQAIVRSQIPITGIVYLS